MSNNELEPWLGLRIPRVPTVFLPYLRRDFRGEEGKRELGREALTESGITALGRALGRPGRDREAAFHLLAADAFFTYGCESAALEDDPPGALRELLDRIGEAFR